jgi:signal transduction histidine kinase
MLDFLRNLFASDFMGHGYCYLWRPEIVWLHVGSDALITLAYYSIPISLVYFVRKRRDLPFHWMFIMFGAFILGCGTTHMMEVWTIWHGTYRLAGIVKLITAGLSLSTAVALIPMMPKALALPSPARLAAANRELEQEARAREQAEDEQRRSFKQLRALAGRIQTAREEERARVAREIHDELGQALTAIKIDLTALLPNVLADPAPDLQRQQTVFRLLDEAIYSVRRIATDLRPGVLDDLGLMAAIEWAVDEFQARTGIESYVSLPDADLALDAQSATALFRILQEALTNVARHARATQVAVRLAQDGGDLSLEVRDNGRGIREEQMADGRSLGVLGMRERAILLGGEFSIASTPENGTTVAVRIPQADTMTSREGR